MPLLSQVPSVPQLPVPFAASAGEKDELVIADFLLNVGKQDVAASVYADIRRLPAAHRLVSSTDHLRVDRYWALPIDGDIRYRRSDEYGERLHEQASNLSQESVL